MERQAREEKTQPCDYVTHTSNTDGTVSMIMIMIFMIIT